MFYCNLQGMICGAWLPLTLSPLTFPLSQSALGALASLLFTCQAHACLRVFASAVPSA